LVFITIINETIALLIFALGILIYDLTEQEAFP